MGCVGGCFAGVAASPAGEMVAGAADGALAAGALSTAAEVVAGCVVGGTAGESLKGSVGDGTSLGTLGAASVGGRDACVGVASGAG